MNIENIEQILTNIKEVEDQFYKIHNLLQKQYNILKQQQEHKVFENNNQQKSYLKIEKPNKDTLYQESECNYSLKDNFEKNIDFQKQDFNRFSCDLFGNNLNQQNLLQKIIDEVKNTQLQSEDNKGFLENIENKNNFQVKSISELSSDLNKYLFVEDKFSQKLSVLQENYQKEESNNLIIDISNTLENSNNIVYATDLFIQRFNSTSTLRKDNTSSSNLNEQFDNSVNFLQSFTPVYQNHNYSLSVGQYKQSKIENGDFNNIPYTEKQIQKNFVKKDNFVSIFNNNIHETINNFQNFSIKQFKILNKLGSGKFSDVYSAINIETGFSVALKQIKKTMIQEYKLEKDIVNEIKSQIKLEHPNIIRLYGYFFEEDSIYLIQELACGKELFADLKAQPNKRYREISVAQYIKQIIEALIYMHSQNIIHRDIKPENIMIYNGILKLCDFGYASYVTPTNLRSTFCGTLDYVSPEMVQGQNYDQSVDIWSVGILTYELIFGQAPFTVKDHESTLTKIQNDEIGFPGLISFEGVDFIQKLLVKDPFKRMTLCQALKHNFIISNNSNKNYQNLKNELEFSDFLVM
ncbi:protein kinase domain protein [Ichthyophthirius multifiliis]|uniref:Aurora kinase n=1 Tax=Ichthyophthirius multifiliis TaxID=5932 RepID=G0QUH1_ICHMU|nr:protein kinase domain protein [Ichthyophthirius multifiliis]EGR31122.1 protein kinase domain protein [Ichthyophthirius multifiliis]|eukprot:XP_004034608.1 protein kinase domain protein [Ichthyophthirius multifiliis]